MNKEVIVTISGLHSSDGENLATKVSGEYFLRNGTHYCVYEEQEEGFDQTTKCTIKIKDRKLEMFRQGLLRTRMIFEEGVKHMTGYQTPYGQMVLGVETKSVRVLETDDCIRVVVEYTLEADGAYLSDSKIDMTIKQK